MSSFFSRTFIIFGLCLIFLAIGLIYQRYTPTRISFKLDGVNNQVVSRDNLPVEIRIKDLNLNLPIVSLNLKRGQLQVSDKGVTYLVSTPMPGEKGNSILYGHNWTNLLGGLTKVKSGSIIEIWYKDSTFKKFKIDSTVIVSPKQSSVLNQTDDKRITLYTCTGFFDTKRFVVVAKLAD